MCPRQGGVEQGFRALGKPDWIPPNGSSLADWCRDREGSHFRKRDLRALSILVLWELWKHRNSIVFDGKSPSVDLVTRSIASEGQAWGSAGLTSDQLEDFLMALSVGRATSP